MSEQEKKRQRIYDLLNAEAKPKFLCLPYIKQRIFFFTGKVLFKDKGRSGGLKKPRIIGFLTAPTTVIKKGSITSIMN